jgi:Tfp pilus assembly protein PilX
MRKKKIITGNERGMTLVIVILIMLALTGIVMGVSSISVNETQVATNEMLDKQVFYLAEAGVEKSIQHLAELSVPFVGSGPNNDQPVNVYDNTPIYNKGTITSYLDPLDTNTGNPTRFVNITVRATLNGNGMSKVLQVQVGQQNFSRYAYFSDLEKSPSGSTIWFHTEDVFHGPVHTNDQMHIYGSPTFYEDVSSGASSVDYYHGGPPQDNPQFHKGLTLDASPIPLPNDTQMLLNAANESGGLKLTGNPVHIRFRVDGSGNAYLNVTIGSTTTDMSYPSNGVIYVQGYARVEGTVKGQVTVGSSGDIEVMDNIVYDTDPRVDPTSTDILGLVAEGDVFMDGYRYGPNYDSADETVMAAIMALNTSWTVEDYSSGSPRGKLTVYGGIIQKQRGPVGTFNSYTGKISTGYEKDYHYDPRLMDLPPPAFPTTGQVEKIAWNEIDPATDITRNFW